MKTINTFKIIIAFLLCLFSNRFLAAESPEKTRYEILQQEIEKHNHSYYQKNQSLISDAAYDALMQELNRLEAKHPDWISKNSSSQKVGNGLQKNHSQAAHLSPMLSIDNTNRMEELYEFLQRIAARNTHFTLNVEEKIDGIALSSQYEKGLLVRALTRGDGRLGNDVTTLMKYIPSVPLRLKGNVPELLEIRGEIFISKSNFRLLNRKTKKKYAGARNAAGGILNAKRPNPDHASLLSLIPHGIGFSTEPVANTQAQLLQEFYKYGFPLKLNAKACSSFQEIESAILEFEKSKDKLDYEIDGAVLKVNELELQHALGTTSKHWRGMIAYKFAASCAWTPIKDIRLQIGRKGKITPVAVLEAVILEGSKIQKVSLHNLDYLGKRDIRIGDSLLVEKKGRTIPQVVSILPGEKRSEKIHVPTCPFCKTKLEKSSCPNPNCPGRTKKGVS